MADIVERLREEAGRDDLAYRTVTVLMDAATAIEQQRAMVDLAGRGCRGGFSLGELIPFLYARSFPKDEWQARYEEACKQPAGK